MADLVAAVGHGWLKVDPNTPGLDGLREALRQFAMSLTRKGIAYSGKRTGTEHPFNLGSVPVFPIQ